MGEAPAGSGSGIRWSKLFRLRPSAARAAKVSTTALAFTAEQDQVAAHNFGHVLLLAAGLVVPGVGLQAAFDVHFAALLQIFAGNFRQALPQNDIVPLGAVLPLAALVLETFVGGDGSLATGVPCGVYLTSGSLPRLPMSCTRFRLLPAMIAAPSAPQG